MFTTLIYFNVSKSTNLDKHLGRLTLAEACEVLDAVSAVKTVCLHVFAENNREVPQHGAVAACHHLANTKNERPDPTTSK